jgi:16S rRNA (adenine1518-N6/adenine1519-N6)-dimethyltransferase
MLRVSLRQLFTQEHPAPEDFFQQELMTKRPEQLTIAQFVELTNLVATALA